MVWVPCSRWREHAFSRSHMSTRAWTWHPATKKGPVGGFLPATALLDTWQKPALRVPVDMDISIHCFPRLVNGFSSHFGHFSQSFLLPGGPQMRGEGLGTRDWGLGIWDLGFGMPHRSAPVAPKTVRLAACLALRLSKGRFRLAEEGDVRRHPLPRGKHFLDPAGRKGLESP